MDTRIRGYVNIWHLDTCLNGSARVDPPVPKGGCVSGAPAVHILFHSVPGADGEIGTPPEVVLGLRYLGGGPSRREGGRNRKAKK